SFSVSVSPTLGTPDAKVWINTTTTTYALKQTPPYIGVGAKSYFVNMTMVPDTNTTALQNYSYTIILPKHYELNTSTTVPSNAPVTFTGFTNFTYTQAGQSIVNLTVREAGGNVTYRNITLFVDDQLPIANIKTNITGSAIQNGRTLRVNEGTVVRFDGSASTDLAYVGKNGV